MPILLSFWRSPPVDLTRLTESIVVAYKRIAIMVKENWSRFLAVSMDAAEAMTTVAFALVISHVADGDVCVDLLNLRLLIAHNDPPFSIIAI